MKLVMERILSHWQPRVQRAEAELAEVFRFHNRSPAVVVVDCLRASTTIVTALAAGAKVVYACATVDEAWAAKARVLDWKQQLKEGKP